MTLGEGEAGRGKENVHDQVCEEAPGGAAAKADVRDQGRGEEGDGGGSSTDGLRLVSSTVASLQATMGGAMQKMAATLKQSLSMMDSMNSCMEEYVRSGLKLGATVSSAPRYDANDGKPHIKISVANTGKMPLTGITLSITFAHPGGDPSSVDVGLEHAGPPTKRRRGCVEITSWSKRDNAGGAQASPHPDVEHQWVAGPFDFAPGDSARSILVVSLPANWGEKVVLPGSVLVGSLTASFPSPGTGAALSVQKPIDVTLISCCSPSWYEPGRMPEEEFQHHGKFFTIEDFEYAKVPACVIRSVFNVSSSKGLSPGCRGDFTLSSFKFVNVTAIATICLLGEDHNVPDNEFKKLDGSGGRDGDDEGEEELQELLAISIRSIGRGQDGEVKKLGEVTRAILDELTVLATASRAAA